METVGYKFAGALNRLGDDKELFHELIEYFREDAPRLLAAMHEGIANGHREGVLRPAHSLRGLLANFDAQEAMKIAASIEHVASKGESQAVSIAIAELEMEIQRLIAALNAHLAETALPSVGTQKLA